MFENLVKMKIIMALPIVTMLMVAGCKENEVNAAMPEPVDLSETEDLFTAPVQPNPLTTDPEAVVVRVNGEDITRGEIMEMMNMAMQQFKGRGIPDEQLQQLQGQLYDQIKNDLITKKLIESAIKQAGIEVDPAEVEETLTQIRESIPEGQTLEGILEQRGQDIESFKKGLSEELASKELIELQTAQITDATEEDAKEFYDSNSEQFVQPEQVSASHILIQIADDDTDEIKAGKKAKLEEIRNNIIAGTVTFEDAAMENSDCPSSAKGGALGTFGKGRMVPEFEAAAFAQEVGEVGSIIETQFGYHLIKVTDHQEEGTIKFDDVKDQVIEYLTNQKKQEAVSSYIEGLRNSATIEEM